MRRWDARAWLALLAPAFLCTGVLLPHPAQAEIITGESVVQGTVSTPQQCAAHRDAFWVQVQQYGICIRYYISTAGGSGEIPIVHLSGDLGGVKSLHSNARSRARSRGRLPRSRSARSSRGAGASTRVGRPRARSAARDRDTRQLLRIANRLSRQTGTTGIHLARMGMDGSSGFHALRRTFLELYVMSVALDELKRRHGFRGFHLVGQSGGSTLIGGLLGIRSDIHCAVPGSGRLAMLDPPRPMRDPLLNRFDPVAMLPNIVRYRTARIMVVTDPADTVVDRRHQDTFVQQLQAAGRAVEQYYVQSTSVKRHGVLVYAQSVAAGCIRGETYEQIADALRGQVAERLQRAAQQGSDPWGRRRGGQRDEPRLR